MAAFNPRSSLRARLSFILGGASLGLSLLADLALEPDSGLSWRTWWLSLGLGSVLAALGWLLAGWVARPLREMARAAELIAQGEADIVIPATDRRDEVGTLAAALEQTVSRLRHDVSERQRAEHRDRLSELSALLHQNLSPRQKLQYVVDMLTGSLGLESASIWLVENEPSGQPGENSPAEFPAGRAVLALQVSSGGMHFSRPRLPLPLEGGRWEDLGGAQDLVFTLGQGQEVLGALLATPVGAEPELEPILQSLAEVLGYVITEARLKASLLTAKRQLGEALDEASALAAMAQLEAGRLRSMIEGMEEGVVVTDQDDLILEVNSWYLGFLGRDRESLLGRPFRQAVPQAWAEAVEGQLGQIRAGAFPGNLVSEMPLGERRYSIRLQPIHSHQAYQGLILNVIDITSLVRAREEAQAASLTKGQFLANMSHEIRTPMNAILGMTALTLGTELTAQQHEYLETVRTSAESLLKLIDDILDLSKIEAGHLSLEQTDFQMRPLLESTLETLAVEAQEKGLELTLWLDPALPAWFQGDPYRLRQVIMNLAGNAIKFTEQGEVVVRLEVQEQGAQETVLHGTVRDTGIGIPAERLDKIFEAFTQADGSTTRGYGGTGLGTTISKDLVEMMGGRIWVESQVGRGSTFHFTVALQNVASRPALVPNWPADILGRPILLALGNATSRQALAEMVQGWGLRPLAAATGAEALELAGAALAQGDAPALAILDGRLPDQDGPARDSRDLATRLRARLAEPLLPLVVLTTEFGGPPRDHFLSLGRAAVVNKPLRHDRLLHALLSLTAPQASPSEGEGPLPAAGQGQPRALRVLLAEDNPLNQKLALALLSGQGWQVTLVENGRQVLEVFRQQPFDLILMDVMMPLLDGLEATAQIRSEERARGGHVPIVAMTAHAMNGDRDRCLQAGMDEYIAKPIDPAKLFKIIASLTGQPPAAARGGGGGQGPAHPLAQDFQDPELARQLIEAYLEDSPRQLRRAAEALEHGDAQELALCAHALKGSVGYFQEDALYQAAKDLEMLARRAELAQAGPALTHLRELMARLGEKLTAFLAGAA